MLVLVAACGSSSSSDGSPAPNPAVSGGGIGGTGKGTITGFTSATAAATRAAATRAQTGSITLNGTRTFTTTAQTEFFLDDAVVTEQELAAQADGMTARVDVGEDVSADFTSGTALRVDARTLVKGPVTGLNPLQVLQQTVLVTADTVLVDNLNPASLKVGDLVAVSGHADALNAIQASRLERKDAATLAQWKLTGPVSVFSGTSFSIGTQQVQLNGVTPEDCGSGLADGLAVKVKAAPDSGYAASDPAAVLTTTTAVECITPGIEVPPELTEGTIQVELEGFVGSVTTTTPPDFTVAGQQVHTTATTLYEHGAATDLVPGARVEVVGTLDVATSVFTAAKVEFRERRVGIDAPLSLVTVDPNAGTLTIFNGTGLPGIVAHRTPMTEDELGVFGGQVPTGVQMGLRGFVDSDNQVYITEIKDGGTAEPTRIELSGPVTDTGSGTTFAVLGVQVATSASTQFFGPDETSIDAATFFGGLIVGDGVQVNDASWDGTQLYNVQEIEQDD